MNIDPRLRRIVAACLEGKTPFVVDNTNLSREDRAKYIIAAKERGFIVRGYFFQSRVMDSLKRNATREGLARVPDLAICGASGQLQLPSLNEGFDCLNFVRLDATDRFIVEEWKNEI